MFVNNSKRVKLFYYIWTVIKLTFCEYFKYLWVFHGSMVICFLITTKYQASSEKKFLFFFTKCGKNMSLKCS